MRFYRVGLALTALVLASPVALAQRTFTFDFEANLTAAADTNPAVSGLNGFFQESTQFRSTYGAYPTLSMRVVSRNSALNAYVGYGINKVYNTDVDLDSQSVTAGGDWQYAISRNWNLRFSENFTRSPDFATLDLFRGILFTPQGIFFDYQTVSLRRNSFANNAQLDVNYTLGPRSKLTFGVAHSLRDYAENPLFQGRLSDQNRYSASVRYSREISTRTSWDVEYRLGYSDFRDFESALSHDPSVGFSHEFSPDLTLRVSLGPSFTQSQGSSDSYLGYHGSIVLSKKLRENEFTLSASRYNGTSTGLGSISDVISVGLGWNTPIGDRLRFALGVSYYDSNSRFDNPVETRGPEASARLSFLVTDNVSFEVGANYQDQNGTDLFQIDRKRAFATLRFTWPEFWRFRR